MNGKTFVIGLTLAISFGICRAQTPSAKDKPGEATELKAVFTDCVAFKDARLTVKFRLDEHFQSYASARFIYPSQGKIKSAKAGQAYVFTFKEEEAAHNLESAMLIDEKNPPKDLSDRALIANVVEVNEKTVVVEWKKDDGIKRFFSREHVFPIRNGKVFEAGQTIKIVFGKDNRHCQGYVIVGDPKKGKNDAEAQHGGNLEEIAKSYLQSLAPPRPVVEDFLKGRTGEGPDHGFKYDAELGWVHCDSIKPDGIKKSRAFYHYEEDGARRVVNFPEKPCRIHAYGDSFTHCSQVSDTETWEEYLAGHFQEPIRNYGVGGYSVYQAYRRMVRVENQAPAKYVILNIYDDDHYRNLDAWREIRAAYNQRLPYTLPHLRVDVGSNRCVEVENPLATPADVLKLCDKNFGWQRFKEDPNLKIKLALDNQATLAAQLVDPIGAAFGLAEQQAGAEDAATRIQEFHTEAALFASQNVVDWAEQFTAGKGQRLMVVLSFGRQKVAADLEGKSRFDQSFVDWLKKKPFPVVDMRDFFRAEFQQMNVDIKTYLDRYYIGHHSPAGNFFTAQSLTDPMLQWLDPAPAPYRAGATPP